MEMEMDEKLKSEIMQDIGPLIEGEVATACVAALGAALLLLVGTNYKSSSLTGDKEIHPTKDSTTISKSEASAKDTDASLGKDEVTAKDGDLSAARTDAVASSGEATALDSGATAARTKAGATDIETKALKMT